MRPPIPTLLVVIVLAATGCHEGDHNAGIRAHGIAFSEAEVSQILELSPLPPPPPSPGNAFADRSAAALLGRFLFFEDRLSRNGQISCATCHQSTRHWTDGKALSVGLDRVSRNAPTLWNVAYNRWQFWDGRKDSLWSQALAPIEHPHEMGGNRLRIFRLVAADGDLRRAYSDVFGDIPVLDSNPLPMDARPVFEDFKHPHHVAWMSLTERDRDLVNGLFANLGKAIEAYERVIISDHSPFDRFVAGVREYDREAMESISAEALRGLCLFIGRGQCVLCHSGPNFSDREFHNIGLDRGALPLDVGRFKAIDTVRGDVFNGLGRFSDEPSMSANEPVVYLAQKPNNLGEFKTPTLRDVFGTAPYMHDGRFADLREVIRFYSRLDQTPAIGHREETLKPLDLTEDEISDLIAFLGTLTGVPLDEEVLRKPPAPYRL